MTALDKMKFTLSAAILALVLSATEVAAAPRIEIQYTFGPSGIGKPSTTLVHRSGEKTGYGELDNGCRTIGTVQLCVDKGNKRGHAKYADGYKRCFRDNGALCGAHCNIYAEAGCTW